jgi:hypothetical protein
MNCAVGSAVECNNDILDFERGGHDMKDDVVATRDKVKVA